MKKKIIAGLVLLLVLLAGTAYAATDGFYNFEDMLPFMKQVHPDWSDQDLQDMYNACHGDNGAVPSNTGYQMMTNL